MLYRIFVKKDKSILDEGKKGGASGTPGGAAEINNSEFYREVLALSDLILHIG